VKPLTTLDVFSKVVVVVDTTVVVVVLPEPGVIVASVEPELHEEIESPIGTRNRNGRLNFTTKSFGV
jgi:hypothetical protein